MRLAMSSWLLSTRRFGSGEDRLGGDVHADSDRRHLLLEWLANIAAANAHCHGGLEVRKLCAIKKTSARMR